VTEKQEHLSDKTYSTCKNTGHGTPHFTDQ